MRVKWGWVEEMWERVESCMGRRRYTYPLPAEAFLNCSILKLILSPVLCFNTDLTYQCVVISSYMY